jgi:hypothetical protein
VRDILGIAVAIMIALLSQIVEPWSGPWWTGMITSAIVATVACSDIVAKQMSIGSLTLPIIAMIVCAISSIGFVLWYFSPMTAIHEKDNNSVGHLVVSKVDGPFFSNEGIISINVTVKNNGNVAAFDMQRYSGTAFDSNPIAGEKLDRLFFGLKQLPRSSTKNSLDPGEGMVFYIYSLRDWRDKYQNAIEGSAYVLFYAIELYKDKNTPHGYIYEKHMCFNLEVDRHLSKCSDHNTNILVKE